MTEPRCCRVCGKPIPAERLEALPNTAHCVEHSDVKKKVGFMVYPHKTGSSIVMIDPDDTEALRQANNANARRR